MQTVPTGRAVSIIDHVEKAMKRTVIGASDNETRQVAKEYLTAAKELKAEVKEEKVCILKDNEKRLLFGTRYLEQQVSHHDWIQGLTTCYTVLQGLPSANCGDPVHDTKGHLPPPPSLRSDLH